MAKVSTAETYKREDVETYRRNDIEHMVRSLVFPSDFAKTGDQIFVKGSGIKLIDIEGKEWIDVSAGGLCIPIGFGNQELAEAAREQMATVAHVNSAGGRATIAEIALVSKLAELVPNKLQRFQFTNSGSDSNETLFKFARWYWRDKGLNKYKIISLDSAYHGATLATLALGMPYFRCDELFGPFPPGFIQTASPYCYRCPWGKSYPGCDIECADALEETIVTEGEDSVAAFICEPIPKVISFAALRDYWSKVMQICKKHQVLLIIDEYITSFGRTGKFFACEYADIKPDMMMFAKGLAGGYFPLSCLSFSEEIYKGLTAKGRYPTHGFTFMGHPVGCAVALKNIEIILRDKLVEHAAEIGKRVQKRMEAYVEQHPYIGDVRGAGVFWMFDLTVDKDTKEPFSPERQLQLQQQIRARLYEKGIVAGALGIGIAPPLIVTEDEIDYIMDAMEYAFEIVKP